MNALTIIQELVQHMEWADSVVFSAILGNPELEHDESLLRPRSAIHLAQKVYFDVWRDIPINPQETDVLSASELLKFAKSIHQDIQRFQSSLSPDDLDQVTHLPWAQQVSANLGFEMDNPSLGQTLLQVSAHSSYHRGQVCARLRELGFNPPMTDFIAWVWAHKPSPTWSARNA